MKKAIFTALFLSIFCGCTTAPEKPSFTKGVNQLANVGRVNNAARLYEGGNLLFVPFRAGSGVLATPELDQLAMMTVKGFIETLNKKSMPFIILNASNADAAELVVRGHITKLDESAGIKNWIGAKSVSLAIEGEIIDQKTGERIVYFSHQKSASEKAKSKMVLAYEIGQEMAQFIIEQFKQKK